MYYDTHAHLNADVFTENLEDIIKEASNSLVSYINVVGFDPKTNELANTIAKKHKNIFASCGLHPESIDCYSISDLKVVEEFLKQDVTVAVGECGLDYYWHKETKEKQIEYFKKQIALSKMYKKPIIIHVRDAFKDAYDILLEASKDGLLQGVMHCFSGSEEMAKRFLDLGLVISLGGPVTFKNAKEPKEVAKMVPIDKLLIETDCPYLAPHPYRGKVNKPSYIPIIAATIATIKEISVEELAQATTNNAKKLFKIE